MRTNGEYTVGILADDLTSAADGAAPFVAQGLPAMVSRRGMPLVERAVVAIDSGSRSISVPAAATRVASLTARLATRDVFYKTVDSTLRGNVSAELEASFKASHRKMLVFAPAFPAAGRTTVHGVQLVDGMPVSESTYGRDPVHPARHSRLIDLVPSSIGSVVILDATTQGELDAQIEAMPEPESILWVGSPGMAAALAKRLAPARRPCGPKAGGGADVLVVIGSANPRSHRQAEGIAQEPGVTLLRTPVMRHDDPAAVLRRIAQDAAERLRGGGFDTLIATGGDTMEAILDRLGIEAFEILREIEPGFPLGLAALDNGRNLLIGMKAGGFGDDDALRRAIAHLREVSAVPKQVLP
ncbi:MAG: four-carbon acid sugar kinase family protein [Mesorhizobium sp.]|uniref:four-carbon acid sugar kinase family protein n=1 Tax=Mesorhizobium sp. TaxID=1871066 RepID=UPI000FE6B555|nr:four-carbon acid sugar kinase family protein [Mesorhizobium sp.]RWC00306.1 MAG: four-carbon acid sugar kinase family protein [Mesorhizobium sp.]